MGDLYNTSITDIHYLDDNDYRKCILKVFNIPFQDDLTKDELCDIYFNKIDTILNCITHVYNTTKDNIAFQILYKVAVEKILHSDLLDLGIGVLFSYDYFYLFHKCLCVFFHNKIDFNTENELFIQLIKQI